MIHLTSIEPAEPQPARTPAQPAALARQNALALMQTFFHTDPTTAEWLKSQPNPPELLLRAQRQIDVARYIVWRLVNKPEADSDMLFLLADALREMCMPVQFDTRTTQSLRLLANLVADEAARRPPACEVAA